MFRAAVLILAAALAGAAHEGALQYFQDKGFNLVD
jgi:hypothetical protein